MPEVDVPITAKTYRNIDESMATDWALRLIDAYLDKDDDSPNINSRPGLLEKIATAEAAEIDGLYWWEAFSALMIVCNRKIFYSTNGTTATTVAGDLLTAGVAPTFATDGAVLIIANGGRMVFIVGLGGVPTFIADADAPTAVTFVAYIDGYFLANRVGFQRFYFCELEDYTTWSALDFASSGGDPDFTIALLEFEKEVFMYGSKSVEIWQNDGATPFSRVDGGYINTGCIAPYSIIRSESGLLWLDSDSRFVRYAGGAIEKFITPYDKDIKSYSAVADCRASKIDILGKTFYKFDFIGENKSLVYNETDNDWNEWGYWNSVAGSHDRFLGGPYVYSPTLKKHFFGSRMTDGKVLEMSPEYFTDNGNPIKFISRSGAIGYGTHKQKTCNEFSMRAKRGAVTDASEPVLTLKIRDDGIEWTNEIELSLGEIGETFNLIREQNMGSYFNRQYEFSGTNAVGHVFGQAKEDITVGAF